MSWLGKWASVGLAALTLGVFPTGASRGGQLLGGVAGKHCWYRVYYRGCNGCWQFYGTYCDCQKAQEVVRYLQVEMFVDAYFRQI